jgi:hypothetical protein
MLHNKNQKQDKNQRKEHRLFSLHNKTKITNIANLP